MANKTLIALKQPLYSLERAYYSRRPRMLKFPDFMSIGSGQAGSTWLFKNLQCHPDVFVARQKETHYFSRNFKKASLHYYSSLYADAGERICGELTPAYNLLIPERIEFIHRLMPDLRILLTIRNPIDRAWSAARRVMSKLAEQQGCEFDDIADEEFHAYFAQEWAYRPERHQGGDYVTGMLQGHYCQAIDNWTSIYPQDNLLVCFFDEIKQQPEQLMRRICQHIRVSTDVNWEKFPLGKVVNKNPSHDIPDRFLVKLQAIYADEIAQLKRRYPQQLANWRM